MFDPTAFLGRGWTGPGELTGWEDWERREPMRFDFADFPGAKLAGLTFATICTRSTTSEVVTGPLRKDPHGAAPLDLDSTNSVNGDRAQH